MRVSYPGTQIKTKRPCSSRGCPLTCALWHKLARLHTRASICTSTYTHVGLHIHITHTKTHGQEVGTECTYVEHAKPGESATGKKTAHVKISAYA